MSLRGGLWVGYSKAGTPAIIDLRHAPARTALLGAGSSRASSLVAIAAKESGHGPVVLDLGGQIANSLSGHLETFDYRSFLHDACTLTEPRAWHSQLAAAAYSAALDLSTEEEAIICAALQQVATQDEMANPISIYGVMGQVEGFRGFYVDKLKGRIGSLKLFDAVQDQPVERLARGLAIVDFHRAPYPQAAELGAALILAKLLALEHSGAAQGCLLMLTEAHRLFRDLPRPLHRSLLLTHALSSPSSLVFATDQPAALDRVLVQSCPVKVHSSESWHSSSRSSGRVLPGIFTVEDGRSGMSWSFFPRLFRTKTGDYLGGKSSSFAPPGLTMGILQTADRYPLSTPESLVQFLAPEFLPSDVVAELAKLDAGGASSRNLRKPKGASGYSHSQSPRRAGNIWGSSAHDGEDTHRMQGGGRPPRRRPGNRDHHAAVR